LSQGVIVQRAEQAQEQEAIPRQTDLSRLGAQLEI